MAKEEIVKSETALAPAPQFITHGDEGLENTRAQDVQIPLFSLMQFTSPMVQDEHFKAGDIVHSITNELLCANKEELSFCPIYHYINWIEWGDPNKGEKMLGMTNDPNHELAQAAARGEKITRGDSEIFRVTEYHNFLSLVLPLEGKVNNPYDLVSRVVNLGLGKTSHKTGRQLIGLAKMRGKYPLFAGQYKLYSETEENSNNQKYKVFKVKNDGWVDEDVFNIASELYKIFGNMLKQNQVKVKYDNEPDTHTEETTETDF